MTLKPCLDCGTPSDDTRCIEHRRHEVKASSTARGYDAAWDTLSRRARRLQPWCFDCGATTDLQADHTPEAWERKAAGLPIRLGDIDVVCGPCNRDRGAARGVAPRASAPDPMGKAEFESHTAEGSGC